MRIHLQSAHMVTIIALALFTALMLAVRFNPKTWRGLVFQALIANLGAAVAVIAFDLLTA